MKRRLAVLSTGRQDWGILRSTCQLLRDDPRFNLCLLIGGMHCSRHFGFTQRMVEEDGFSLSERLDWIPDDGALSAQEQAARALAMVGDALVRHTPESLMLVGDRFETAAAAVAATLARVPLIHVHGGEETQGAFDNAFRHAVTKMSHLHLVSHPLHAARVASMGEDPAAIHVVGAPGLDNLQRTDLADRLQLATFLGVPLHPPVVLVTLHPTTLGGDPAAEARAVTDAMDAVPATYVLTLPNADPGNELIRSALSAAANGCKGRVAVEALGDQRYWGLLQVADALLGNSSSAIIEAPLVGLPAVNVGERQRGRTRGQNILDVRAESAQVAAALRKALTPDFRALARAAPSPFGDGRSGMKILSILAEWTPPRPPIKRTIRC